MSRAGSPLVMVIMILTFIVLAPSTQAQVTGQTHCGIASPSGGVVATQFYDPFSPAPLSSQSINLTLSRFVGVKSGQKTQQVNFYFTQPAGTPPGFQLLYQGGNVLYTAGAGGLGLGAPALSTSSSAATGTIGFNFGNTIDVFSPQVTLSVPAGLDLSNGLTVNFNIVYACNGTGDSFSNVSSSSPDSLVNALILPVAVLNALQAYYAGPALDFGEIGPLSQTQVLSAPSTYTKTGYIHVASSGPYTVSLRSSAPNPYRMTYSGGSTSATGQFIPYRVSFLGQTVSNANFQFTTKGCIRAGVGAGVNIPLSATLEDGGIGKAVGAYQDSLEVTITPLVNAPVPGSCG